MRVAVRRGIIYVQAPRVLHGALAEVPGSFWNNEYQCYEMPDNPLTRNELRMLDVALPGEEGHPDEVPGAKTRPWAHQVAAYWHARRLLEAGIGAMLAMEMGTGKSKVAVDLICTLPRVSRVLILCPKSVVPVWGVQFERHSPREYTVTALSNGSVRQRAALVAALRKGAGSSGGITAIAVNYDAFWRPGLLKELAAFAPDMLVCDESHRLQAPGGKASRSAATLAKKIRYRLALTGTPMSSGPMALYGQYRVIAPEVFGTSFSQFRYRYAVMGGFENKQVLGVRDEAAFSRKFHSVAFVAKADDVLDLPPAVDVRVSVSLSASAMKVYQEMDEEFIADVGEGLVTASNGLTRILRLMQITSGHVCTEDGTDVEVDRSKREALADLIDGMGGEPVAVFCLFRKDLQVVREVAAEAGLPYCEVSGSENTLSAWRGGVIGVQIQSGSEGIDLTLARYAVYYSLNHSLFKYEQSRARIRRPGQTRPVTYYSLVAEGTVDEDIYLALERKQNVVEAVIAAAKGGRAWTKRNATRQCLKSG